MSLFNKLFKSKKVIKNDVTENDKSLPIEKNDFELNNENDLEVRNVLDILASANEKDNYPKFDVNTLLHIFIEYFAPNLYLYTDSSKQAYKSYFFIVNKARDELIYNPALVTKATKWSINEIISLINNPQPGITNMIILGLIFRIGWYCVTKESLFCIDFCDRVPNCIALYLLLIALKDSNYLTQLLDLGVGADKSMLQESLMNLKPCSDEWKPIIL